MLILLGETLFIFRLSAFEIPFRFVTRFREGHTQMHAHTNARTHKCTHTQSHAHTNAPTQLRTQALNSGRLVCL